MPTVRQQRALGRADQDFGSGCSPLATATKLCSPPCATASARARPITSRGHRRVERAAKVALPRLFIPSPCCTRAPGSPTTSGVCPFWGVLGVLDVVAGFSRCSASWRPIRCRLVNPASNRGDTQDSHLHQEFHCTRQRRNRRGTSRVVSTTLHDRKNASAATRGNKSCILRPRESAAASMQAERCAPVATTQPAPRAGLTR